MGCVSSNLHAVFFEVNDIITRNGNKNSMEVNIGDISEGEQASKVEGCSIIKEGKFSGGRHIIDLSGNLVQEGSKCSDEGNDKILDNEKYFSSCFLVPKNLKVKEDDGTDISNKCKLVYKTELKCEGDDLLKKIDVTSPIRVEEHSPSWIPAQRAVRVEEQRAVQYQEVEEPFTNLKKNDNNNGIQCIFIAIIILALFITIKRKNF